MSMCMSSGHKDCPRPTQLIYIQLAQLFQPFTDCQCANALMSCCLVGHCILPALSTSTGTQVCGPKQRKCLMNNDPL